MATILTKKSDTASAVPLAADLTNAAGGAELAVNATDKRLFSKTSGGTVVELGTNPSTLVLPSGSANGVAYLNGSKVVTSGSALTFDGTNFGIGAATALKPLDISFAGTSGARRFLASYDDSVITIKGANASNDPEAIRIIGDNIRFNTGTSGSGSEGMRLTSTGLGIGTSSPAYKLDVVGPVQSSAGYYINGNTGGGYVWVRDNYALRFGTNDTERARIDSSGNLLVGTTSTSNGALINWYKASGTIETSLGGITTAQNHIVFANPNGNVGSIQVDGSATSYNTSSDYRLKNTIAPMTGALAKVALLKPCTYKWNVDGSEGEGFIAHELAEVVPQCVSGEKDAVDEEGNPKYQGIDTSFLVATLTAAIQELNAKFEAYKASHP